MRHINGKKKIIIINKTLMKKIRLIINLLLLISIIIVLHQSYDVATRMVYAEETTKIITNGLTVVRNKLNKTEIQNYYFEYYNLTPKTFSFLCKKSDYEGLIKKSHNCIYDENKETYSVFSHGSDIIMKENALKHSLYFNKISNMDIKGNLKTQFLGNPIIIEKKIIIDQELNYIEDIIKYMDYHYEKINEILSSTNEPINLYDSIIKNSYDYLQYKYPNYYCKNQEDYEKNLFYILNKLLEEETFFKIKIKQ